MKINLFTNADTTYMYLKFTQNLNNGEMTRYLNNILEERLIEKGVRVWRHADGIWRAIQKDDVIETAIAVCIEPIEKKCEKHEPEIFNDQGRFGVCIPYSKAPKCALCGKFIKATWSVCE